MLRYVLFFSLLAASKVTLADDIDYIAGRYTYVSYAFTLPDGYSGGFREFGSSGATIEIGADKSMVMTMHMLDGTRPVSRAEILEIDIKNGKGYMLVRWPEMASPVRQEFETDGRTLSYVIRFRDPQDVIRYGGSDQGVLVREAATEK